MIMECTHARSSVENTRRREESGWHKVSLLFLCCKELSAVNHVTLSNLITLSYRKPSHPTPFSLHHTHSLTHTYNNPVQYLSCVCVYICVCLCAVFVQQSSVLAVLDFCLLFLPF